MSAFGPYSDHTGSRLWRRDDVAARSAHANLGPWVAASSNAPTTTVVSWMATTPNWSPAEASEAVSLAVGPLVVTQPLAGFSKMYDDPDEGPAWSSWCAPTTMVFFHTDMCAHRRTRMQWTNRAPLGVSRVLRVDPVRDHSAAATRQRPSRDPDGAILGLDSRRSNRVSNVT